MRKTLTSIGIALALSAGAAHAAPIVLPLSAPLFFQFNNLEQIGLGNSIVVPGGSIDVNGDGINDTPTDEGNWGVFNVSSLQSGAVSSPNSDIAGGPGFFVDDGPVEGIFNQGQVTGIFYGVQLTSGTTAMGGWLDVYWEDPADDDVTAADLAGGFSPANRTAANQAGIFTDGTLLVRLQMMPGIVTGDAVTTLASTIDVSGTIPQNGGQAQFFADVVDINNDGQLDALDGAWAFSLDSDWFFTDVDGDGIRGEAGERRDLRFATFFNTLASWNNGPTTIGLRSNDPGRAFTVPEPGMLSLMGLGLLGAGIKLRRRNRS